MKDILIGESLLGEGNEIAHIDLLIGSKDGRTLFDHLDPGTVSGFVADCRRRGLLCGLAGSLGPDHLPLLLELGPDVIGVRGAICEGGRNGRLDSRRLSSLREALLGAIAGGRPSGE